MNRNPSGLLFSQCIDGFVKYKTAESLSRRTVDSYEWVLRKWMEKLGDKPVGKISSADVLDYMTYLRTEYVPHTFAKPNPAHDAPTRKLFPKTLRNHWVTFKAFFGWAVADLKSRMLWKAYYPPYKILPYRLSHYLYEALPLIQVMMKLLSLKTMIPFFWSC
ncbi:MAG: hypothetical protein WA110_06045 [Anaerolineaceae bacterium]